MSNKPWLATAACTLLFLSACDAGPAAPGAHIPTSPGGATACTPVPGGIPKTAKDFNCLDLVSVTGADMSGKLDWLGTDPFTLTTNLEDGGLRLGSKTPCNTLGAALKVTDSQLVVDPGTMVQTAMGCQSPESDREQWVVNFLSQPMDYLVKGDTLVLNNPEGFVVLKAATFHSRP